MKVSISDLADKANIKFGTSGLRGLVTDLSDEVCFAYTQAFLQSTPIKDKRVVIGYDLRPSSPLRHTEQHPWDYGHRQSYPV